MQLQIEQKVEKNIARTPRSVFCR